MQLLEVHVYLEFRQRACHQLAITAEDVSSGGSNVYAILLHPVGHLYPVILLCNHYVQRPEDDACGNNRHDYCESTVAWHYLVSVEFAHVFVFLL